MEEPELPVLQHNLLEVFEGDHRRIYLAQLAELEELDGGDRSSVPGETLEHYNKKKLERS